jgi:hypothetical protein
VGERRAFARARFSTRIESDMLALARAAALQSRRKAGPGGDQLFRVRAF